MSTIMNEGGYPINGEIMIQGSKNAALPILAAAFLIKDTVILENCPQIRDVQHMMSILTNCGARIEKQSDCVIIHAQYVNMNEVPEVDARSMRSSVLLLGAMMPYFKEISVPHPGGCTIGKRPIDWHLLALEQMGVMIEKSEYGLFCKVEKLKGATIQLPFPSVGVTENIILASVLAEGETIITGAAMEPEIVDLCLFLNECGAQITGYGTNHILIKGVKKLHGTTYRLMADRIVAGTYLVAAATTQGSVVVRGIKCNMLKQVLNILADMGCGLIIYNESIKIKAPPVLIGNHKITTAPFPGFPTDMQSQMMVALCVNHGLSTIEENIFENRFRIVAQLQKMGASLTINHQIAKIKGPCILKGATLCAEDLRGGAALVIAAMAAEGKSIVQNSEFIKRGYCHLIEDLQNAGARIIENED